MISSYSGYRSPWAQVPACPQQFGFWERTDLPHSLQLWLLFSNTQHNLSSFSCHIRIEDHGQHTSEGPAYISSYCPSTFGSCPLFFSIYWLSNAILSVRRLFQVGFLSSNVLSFFQLLCFPRCNAFCFSAVGEFPPAKNYILLNRPFQMFSLQPL